MATILARPAGEMTAEPTLNKMLPARLTLWLWWTNLRVVVAVTPG